MRPHEQAAACTLLGSGDSIFEEGFSDTAEQEAISAFLDILLERERSDSALSAACDELQEGSVDAVVREFESVFRARSFEERESRLQALVKQHDLQTLLDVATEQYDAFGDEERLRLAARVATEFGAEAYAPLRAHLERHPDQLVYFTGVMISPDLFTLEQQRALVNFAVEQGDEDVLERLDGSLDWMSLELADYVTERLAQNT